MSDWRDIATADPSALFSRSEWVLIATDKGRVTEGLPYYFDSGKLIWVCARGMNCNHPGANMTFPLPETVTHWQPLPDPPVIK